MNDIERDEIRDLLAHRLGVDAGGFRRRDLWTFAQGDAVPMDASWERRGPARPAAVVSDVVVPGLQASVTALVAGVLARLLGASWGTVAVVLVGAFGISWALLLVDHRRLLWALETLTRLDIIDRSGDVGEPEQRRVTVEVVDRNQNGRGRIGYYNLSVDDQTLADVARAVLTLGVPFSRPGLTGAGVISHDQYRALAQEFVEAGLAVDVPPNKRILTAAGRSLLRQLLDD